VVGEIKVLVLERHEVVSLGLESILEGSPASSVEAPDRPSRLVLITGGERDDLKSERRVKADGYMVLRDVTAESLRAAMLAVLAGEIRLPDEVTTYLLDIAGGDRPGAGARMPRLSPREHDVLELVVAGHSNQEIANELGISIHGAKRHVSSILGKFDSPSRSHLVTRVLQARSGQALGA
jgi:DNA-binding NarL/FixJ family response regulator